MKNIESKKNTLRYLIGFLPSDKDFNILKNFIINYKDLIKYYQDVYDELAKKITEVYVSTDIGNQLLKSIIENDITEKKEATKYLISQSVIQKLISKITYGANSQDDENADIYIKLQSIADDDAKQQFISKNISLIPVGAKALNILDQPSTFVIKNLKATSFPPSLNNFENDYYQRLVAIMRTLTNNKDKLEIIDILFNNFGLISDKHKQEFIKNDVNNCINLFDAVQNIALCVLMAKQDNKKYQILDESWKVLAKRSFDLQNQELYICISRYYLNVGNELKNYIMLLLGRNINSAINVIKILQPEMKEANANSIIEGLIEFSRNYSDSLLPNIFNTMIDLCKIASDVYRNKIGDRFLELINELNNLNRQELGLNYLSKIRINLTDTKRRYIAQQVMQNFPKKINEQNFDSVNNLIRAILLLQDDLSEYEISSFIDYILPMIVSDTFPDKIRVKVSRKFSQLKKIPKTREIQVLKELFNTLKTSESNAILFDVLLYMMLTLKDNRANDNEFWKEFDSYININKLYTISPISFQYSDAQKKIGLGFDDLKTQGWSVTQEDKKRPMPKFMPKDDNKYGKTLEILSNFTDPMDYIINPPSMSIRHIEYIGQFKTQEELNWTLYVKVKLKDTAKQKIINGWLRIWINSGEPKLRYENDNNQEWDIFVNKKPIVNEWSSIIIDINKYIDKTFRTKNLRYDGVWGVRLRGAMRIAKIIPYRILTNSDM